MADAKWIVRSLADIPGRHSRCLRCHKSLWAAHARLHCRPPTCSTLSPSVELVHPKSQRRGLACFAGRCASQTASIVWPMSAPSSGDVSAGPVSLVVICSSTIQFPWHHCINKLLSRFFGANPLECMLEAGSFLLIARSFQTILKGPFPDPEGIFEGECKKTSQAHLRLAARS